MASLGGKTTNQYRVIFEKVHNAIQLVRNMDHRLYGPWSKEEGPKIRSLEERSKLLDVFFKEWDAIVIAELGLRKADFRKFWGFYSQAVRLIWPELTAIRICVLDEDELAQKVLEHWKAVERMYIFTLHQITPGVFVSLCYCLCIRFPGSIIHHEYSVARGTRIGSTVAKEKLCRTGIFVESVETQYRMD